MKRPARACSAKKRDRQWLSGQPQRSRGERGGAFEVVAAPAHSDDRAPIRERAVLEVECCPGALQQGLGNEEAQSEPARLAVNVLPASVGDIGLPDPVHDLRRKARTI